MYISSVRVTWYNCFYLKYGMVGGGKGRGYGVVKFLINLSDYRGCKVIINFTMEETRI
jgi:CRISPR/Cas system CSM-associated protein Csm3 (group 7 of RAMP superfamily)